MFQLPLPNQGVGLCKCGCGYKTTIAIRNRKASKGRGKWIKGEPKPFIRGHNRNRPYRPLDIPLGSKYCITCKQIKSMNEFYRNRAKHQSLQPYCKNCSRIKHKKWVQKNRTRIKEYMRQYNVKQLYGVDALHKYEELRTTQNGQCAICERTEKIKRFLAVDHDHKTKKIRGLLCSACNRALGLFQDDIQLLQKAIDYLKKHSYPPIEIF